MSSFRIKKGGMNSEYRSLGKSDSLMLAPKAVMARWARRVRRERGIR